MAFKTALPQIKADKGGMGSARNFLLFISVMRSGNRLVPLSHRRQERKKCLTITGKALFSDRTGV
jgi:hypothetical protein